jgi:ATP-dependent Lon protease
MEKEFDLSCIRIGTDDDLADAMALASRLLSDAPVNLDFVTRQFSSDLLVAVLMSTAYGTRDKTLAEVLLYLVDPSWDSPRQILLSFSQER